MRSHSGVYAPRFAPHTRVHVSQRVQPRQPDPFVQACEARLTHRPPELPICNWPLVRISLSVGLGLEFVNFHLVETYKKPSPFFSRESEVDLLRSLRG